RDGTLQRALHCGTAGAGADGDDRALNVPMIAFTTLSGFFIAVAVVGVNPGAFLASFFTQGTLVDLFGGEIKCILVAALVAVLGQIILFAVSALRSVPRALRYHKEIWWYAAFLAIGSTPVALAMTYFSGAECSVEAYHTLHQLGGSESYAGIFNALCDLREITPLFFGFAIGAKVGCGLVAELGTMRINEEIDALETMGVPSVPFLVSTRMIACLLVLPLMYVLSLATSFFASWVVQRFQIGLVSNGVYFSYFWRFTNLT